MKRFLLILISLLVSVPLALGIVAGLAYRTTTESAVPRPAVVVLDQNVLPCGYQWREPVFGGLIYRDFNRTAGDESNEPIGDLYDPLLNITLPEGYKATATVERGGQVVLEGDMEQLAAFQFIDNGLHTVHLRCTSPDDPVRGHGFFDYRFSFRVRVEPRLEHSDPWVAQGDVLAIRVFNLSEDMIPEIVTDIDGEFTFAQSGDGHMTAYLPVGYDVQSGGYTVKVRVNRYEWEISLRVTEQSFPVQNLTVDENAEVPESNSAGAQRQYREAMAEIFAVPEETIYWSGRFESPAEGDISAEYGMFTYVNSSRDFTRHAGIDIAAARGSDVIAPNAGKVVFAGRLTHSGNTIVVDHGGGLQSVFQHLDKIGVEEGDMVKTGQVIGAVGATGYAEKPHLHYEIRLYGVPINPVLLFSGACRLYFF